MHWNMVATALRVTGAAACLLLISRAEAATPIVRAKLVHDSGNQLSDALDVGLNQAAFEADQPVAGRLLGSEPRTSPHVSCDQRRVVVIRFFDGATGVPISITQAGVSAVSYQIGSSVAMPVALGPTQRARHYLWLAADSAGNGFGGAFCKGTRYGEEAVITVEFGGLPPETFAVRRKKLWDTYGWNFDGSGIFGIWAPVGVLATKMPLERTDDGIVFAALPISLAVGGRIWTPSNFYFGISGIGSYAFVSTNAADPAAQAHEIVVGGVAAGALLDVNSVVYFTLTHHWSFKAGEPNPGFMVGVGPGAALVEAIASGRFK